ncbi:HNH endonuclease [Vibrio phage D529]
MAIAVKRIKGFEDYAVSRCGRIYSWKSKRWLKQSTQSKGYNQVCLSVNNKQSMKLVHRLVAEAFIPNPLGLKEINHLDENKSNNNLDNLEWCDRLTNANYSVAKHYKLITPTGELIEIKNLSRFTKEHSLNRYTLYQGRKSKGWKLVLDR